MGYLFENRTKQRSLKEFCLFLKDVDYHPRTIIDVGVASYTEGLYSFENCKFFLFEPLPDFKEKAESLIENKTGKFFPVALSDKEGEGMIAAPKGALDCASLNLEGNSEHFVKYEVSIKRLDECIDLSELDSPVILKIDVQGMDYYVLKGANKLLKGIDIVIFEFMYFGDVGFYEYVKLLNEFDFSSFEVMSQLRRPYDDAVSQSDFIFVKNSSKLKGYKRYQ